MIQKDVNLTGTGFDKIANAILSTDVSKERINEINTAADAVVKNIDTITTNAIDMIKAKADEQGLLGLYIDADGDICQVEED